jgi:hypothetical protein
MNDHTKLDFAAWAACPYIRQWIESSHKKKICSRCSKWEIVDGEKYQRACRGIVEEILKPALEAYENCNL